MRAEYNEKNERVSIKVILQSKEVRGYSIAGGRLVLYTHAKIFNSGWGKGRKSRTSAGSGCNRRDQRNQPSAKLTRVHAWPNGPAFL